jgi:hypothetical protein
VGRGVYVFWGLLLFGIKYNLDRLVAWQEFHRSWSPMMYLTPWETAQRSLVAQDPAMIPQDELQFHLTMLAIALPFIYTGSVLTLRRLRSAGLPVTLVMLFFVPMVNLLFFAMMALMPPAGEEGDQPGTSRFKQALDRIIPRNAWGSALLGIFISALLGLGAEALSVSFFRNYGWGLFVGLPFCMGLMPVLVYGYHERRPLLSCMLTAWASSLLLALMMIAFAVEGLICILMLLPLALVFSTVGGFIGYLIQSRIWATRQTHAAFLALAAAMPLLMGAEANLQTTPRLYAVKTAVDIDAPPQKVWRHVVSFSQLPPPTDPLFLYGIAYPQYAVIHGTGVGAVRHCVFSTGPFVEPITVWDEPRLLKFDVAQQPPAMQEMSPYPDLKPPHLDDYLVSKGGQFLLTPLPNGGTHLEGTTWYSHKIWPAAYWHLWSDTIIHRIHQRVLEHIKHETETESSNA